MTLFRIEFTQTDSLVYQTDKFSVIVKANTINGAFKRFDKLTKYKFVDSNVTILKVSRRNRMKFHRQRINKILNETAILNKAMNGIAKLFEDFEDDGSNPGLTGYMGFIKAFDFPINPMLNRFI